jgi:hypothetical protein
MEDKELLQDLKKTRRIRKQIEKERKAKRQKY